jgi:hypothetical protein
MMSVKLRIAAVVCAVLAFGFCLLGGLWILSSIDFGKKEDALSVGIGFYFVGKALFVGPMLVLAAIQLEQK